MSGWSRGGPWPRRAGMAAARRMAAPSTSGCVQGPPDPDRGAQAMSEARTALEDKVVEAARAAARRSSWRWWRNSSPAIRQPRVGRRAARRGEAQRLLARRLQALGAQTDLWEPEPTGTGNRHVPDYLDFHGRPQLSARLPGTGVAAASCSVATSTRSRQSRLTLWTAIRSTPRLAGGRSVGGGRRHERWHRLQLVALESLHRPA